MIIRFAIGVYLTLGVVAAYHIAEQMNEDLPPRDIGDYATVGFVALCVVVGWAGLALLAGFGKLVTR